MWGILQILIIMVAKKRRFRRLCCGWFSSLPVTSRVVSLTPPWARGPGREPRAARWISAPPETRTVNTKKPRHQELDTGPGKDAASCPGFKKIHLKRQHKQVCLHKQINRCVIVWRKWVAVNAGFWGGGLKWRWWVVEISVKADGEEV